MWQIIEFLGWTGWLIGAICLVGFLWQRDVNRQREKDEAAKDDNPHGTATQPGEGD
ncbi:MAG: hypothetical protein JNN07_18330 [Verrucomicrobiales bacterium]|nr:hypothetical protein [Verrucomicrobiales bacterium]